MSPSKQNPRPAPYSLEVRGELEAGRHPAVHVFSGQDSWRRAEHRRLTHGLGTALVLPPGESPEIFDWPPVEPEAIVITGVAANHHLSLEMRLRAACTRTKRTPERCQ